MTGRYVWKNSHLKHVTSKVNKTIEHFTNLTQLNNSHLIFVLYEKATE